MVKLDIPHKETERVVSYLCAVAIHLALPPYTFYLLEEACGDEAEATIEVVEGRMAAKVSLGVNWMDRDESDRQRTLTHEVCHLLHRDIDHLLKKLSERMGVAHHIELMDEYNYRLELMVDHIANTMAPDQTLRQVWLNPPE
jgi:hypothetical protein